MGRPAKTAYVCQNCGAMAARWSGRCAACNEWNSLVEEAGAAAAPGFGGGGTGKGRALSLESLSATHTAATAHLKSGAPSSTASPGAASCRGRRF
jgi:DNA repair protein RadA/Sms